MTDERWHGTYGGYTNHGCRCVDCTRANTDHMRDYLSRHPEQVEKHRSYARHPEVIKRRHQPEAKARKREYDRARYARQKQEATLT